MVDHFFISIFLVFICAACLSTLALVARQSLIIGYVVAGMILGPFGWGLVRYNQNLEHIGEIGVTFLIFLLGLHFKPKDLVKVLQEVVSSTLMVSFILFVIGFFLAHMFHYNTIECALVGMGLLFSSTIISLKLLPYEGQKRISDLVIGISFVHDLLAIFAIVAVNSLNDTSSFTFSGFFYLIFVFFSIFIVSFYIQKHFLIRLIQHFKFIQEYVLLMSIGWCFAVSAVAELCHLPIGIGAFMAGVSLAPYPIAHQIADDLHSIRDFFLVIFFFSMGASFDTSYLQTVGLAAFILAILSVAIKPWIIKKFLVFFKEKKYIASEVGARLGQCSEFSIILAYMAINQAPDLVSKKLLYFIQCATLMSFIFSSHLVVLKYPSPMRRLKNR